MMDIGAQFATWREHPAQMVRELFGVEPDPWQVEALERFPHSQRLCMKASKGVGKTAVEAWLIWNFLLTRPHPKIAATAITGPNLADNLWTELALWRSKSELLRSQFEWTKTRIFAKSAPETWWCSARTCPQNAARRSRRIPWPDSTPITLCSFWMSPAVCREASWPLRRRRCRPAKRATSRRATQRILTGRSTALARARRVSGTSSRSTAILTIQTRLTHFSRMGPAANPEVWA
jgi:hypothetical protein